MTVNKFIRNLLNLKELSVTHFELHARKRALDLWVKPYKNGCLCPQCHRRGRIVRIMDECRLWRDLTLYGCTVMLWYCPKEIMCPTHGRVQENIPWADDYSRITYRFEYAMLVYCQIMTQKAAAQMLHIAQSTLSDLLHRSIERIRDGHRIRDLKAVGVDEISYCKGHKYATIVYDIKKACVVWVGKGKGENTIDRFFKEMLSDYQKRKSKESRPKGPGFGLPPGRGLSMILLCSTYLWSVGVMEYWKNENPTPIFCNFKQRASRISDV